MEDLGDKIILFQGTDGGGRAYVDNGRSCKALSVAGYLGIGGGR